MSRSGQPHRDEQRRGDDAPDSTEPRTPARALVQRERERDEAGHRVVRARGIHVRHVDADAARQQPGQEIANRVSLAQRHHQLDQAQCRGRCRRGHNGPHDLQRTDDAVARGTDDEEQQHDAFQQLARGGDPHPLARGADQVVAGEERRHVREEQPAHADADLAHCQDHRERADHDAAEDRRGLRERGRGSVREVAPFTGGRDQHAGQCGQHERFRVLDGRRAEGGDQRRPERHEEREPEQGCVRSDDPEQPEPRQDQPQRDRNDRRGDHRTERNQEDSAANDRSPGPEETAGR